MSDSNQAELLYVKNNASDVMPANSSLWRPFRLAGADGLTSTPGTTQSNETRADRNRSDVLLVSRTTGGPLPAEFSADSFDDFILAALQKASFTAGVAVNGKDKQSFTFLRRFKDFATEKRIRYDKVRTEGFGLTWAYGSIATANVTLVGSGVDMDAADAVGSGTVLPAFTTPPMSGVDIQNISIDGITTGLCAQSGSLQFNNNFRARNCVENGADPADNTTGSFNATAGLRIYNGETSFPLHTVKNDQTPVEFSYEITDGTTTYLFEYPHAYLSFTDASSQGLDTDVMLDMTVTGSYDPGIDGTVRVTKTT